MLCLSLGALYQQAPKRKQPSEAGAVAAADADRAPLLEEAAAASGGGGAKV